MAGLVQYNFTIDDTSPVLTYSPYGVHFHFLDRVYALLLLTLPPADFDSANGRGDGLQNGWQTWYSGSGYLSSADGPTPNGESFHLTSLPGASVSLSFYGMIVFSSSCPASHCIDCRHWGGALRSNELFI